MLAVNDKGQIYKSDIRNLIFFTLLSLSIIIASIIMYPRTSGYNKKFYVSLLLFGISILLLAWILIYITGVEIPKSNNQSFSAI